MYQSPFSRGKSFGKILGYLDAKTPAICSDEVDHALFFDAGQGIVSNDVNVWEAAICDWIAAPHLRQGIADNAFKAFEDRLSVATSSRFVDGFLRELL